jgi:hypothetical protein
MKNQMLKMNIVTPEQNSVFRVGTCLTCYTNFDKCEHRLIEREKERRFSKVLQGVVVGIESERLCRIAAKFELESDEFSTWKEKAKSLIPARSYY